MSALCVLVVVWMAFGVVRTLCAQEAYLVREGATPADEPEYDCVHDADYIRE